MLACLLCPTYPPHAPMVRNHAPMFPTLPHMENNEPMSPLCCMSSYSVRHTLYVIDTYSSLFT